jgi:hypothetical protein
MLWESAISARTGNRILLPSLPACGLVTMLTELLLLPVWSGFVLWTWLLIVRYLSFTSGRSFRLLVKNMIRLIYPIWYVIGVMDRLLSAAFHSCGEMWRLIWIIRKRERGSGGAVVISRHLFWSPVLILRPANKFRVTEMCCLIHNALFFFFFFFFV